MTIPPLNTWLDVTYFRGQGTLKQQRAIYDLQLCGVFCDFVYAGWGFTHGDPSSLPTRRWPIQGNPANHFVQLY